MNVAEFTKKIKHWQSYLVAYLIYLVVEEGIKRCGGCRDSRLSPILHAHHTISLKQKIDAFCEDVKLSMWNSIQPIASNYRSTFDPYDKDITEQTLIKHALM